VAQLNAWADGLTSRATADRLSVTSTIGFDPQIDQLLGASVRLNWPTGEESSAHNRTGLPARLERAWGAILVRARERLVADSGDRSLRCAGCDGSGLDYVGDWDDGGRDGFFRDHTCERCGGRGWIFVAA
jgi:hypothetical protein